VTIGTKGHLAGINEESADAAEAVLRHQQWISKLPSLHQRKWYSKQQQRCQSRTAVYLYNYIL